MAKKTKSKTKKSHEAARAGGKRKLRKRSRLASRPPKRRSRKRASKVAAQEDHEKQDCKTRTSRKKKAAASKAIGAAASKLKPAAAGKGAYYITTAISYPNGAPHIGHAYEVIATDTIARFMRLDGYDVYFLTGTDEHGQKIQQTAAKEGLTRARTRRAQRAALSRHGRADELLERRFHPHDREAASSRHRPRSGNGWRRTATSICRNIPAGIRCATRRSTTRRKRPSARTRSAAAPQGTPVEWVEEESYFFKLSAYQQKLLDLYAKHPDFVLPKERLNEVASFVRGGLQDLSISRTTFDWGIRVPGDPKHIMYVWVDALTNYITGVGFPDTQSEKFKRYWPAASACDRQGHRALSRGVLAGLPDVGRHRGAQAHFQPRISVQPRRENVEVGRQCDRSVRARRRLWRRSAALFLPARSAVRPGRQLQPRSDRQPHQCRSRQRSRQSGAALAVHDRQAIGRRAAEARRFQRQRQDDPCRRRRA